MHACISKPVLREDGDALIEDTESRREKLMKDAMRKLAEE
jgi:hypothetical protein